uniref:Uncharacterized protein n=1 Tax=Salarias fasciatus TaxID=181472 RepID=A0A672GBB8_SALFA
ERSCTSFVVSHVCDHGRWNCSLEHCPVDGALSPWGPWTPCSLSCGGLGLKTRSRACTDPAPAHGGRDCRGPRLENTYCQAPDCPGTAGGGIMRLRGSPSCLRRSRPQVRRGSAGPPCVDPSSDSAGLGQMRTTGFSPWSSWTPCSRTCTDALRPATKSRRRLCATPPCSGSSLQEKPCNLPQCPGESAPDPDRNPTGPARRLTTVLCVWSGGGCVGPDLDGGWSRWSPWSRCDKPCGGGRSIRTRSCSSPPPKNGGRKCEGEKNQVKPCNTRPCAKPVPPQS